MGNQRFQFKMQSYLGKAQKERVYGTQVNKAPVTWRSMESVAERAAKFEALGACALPAASQLARVYPDGHNSYSNRGMPVPCSQLLVKPARHATEDSTFTNSRPPLPPARPSAVMRGKLANARRQFFENLAKQNGRTSESSTPRASFDAGERFSRFCQSARASREQLAQSTPCVAEAVEEAVRRLRRPTAAAVPIDGRRPPHTPLVTYRRLVRGDDEPRPWATPTAAPRLSRRSHSIGYLETSLEGPQMEAHELAVSPQPTAEDLAESRARSMDYLLEHPNDARLPENTLQGRNKSEHELRVERSLQNLDLPDWYKQTTLPKEGFLLKRRTSGGWHSTSRTSSVSSLTSGSGGTSLLLTGGRSLVIPKRVTTSGLEGRESLPSSTASLSPRDSPLARWGSGRLSLRQQPYLGWRAAQAAAQASTPSSGTASPRHSYLQGVYDSQDSDYYRPKTASPPIVWMESSFVGATPTESTPEPAPPAPTKKSSITSMEEILDSLLAIPGGSRSSSPTTPRRMSPIIPGAPRIKSPSLAPNPGLMILGNCSASKAAPTVSDGPAKNPSSEKIVSKTEIKVDSPKQKTSQLASKENGYATEKQDQLKKKVTPHFDDNISLGVDYKPPERISPREMTEKVPPKVELQKENLSSWPTGNEKKANRNEGIKISPRSSSEKLQRKENPVDRMLSWPSTDKKSPRIADGPQSGSDLGSEKAPTDFRISRDLTTKPLFFRNEGHTERPPSPTARPMTEEPLITNAEVHWNGHSATTDPYFSVSFDCKWSDDEQEAEKTDSEICKPLLESSSSPDTTKMEDDIKDGTPEQEPLKWKTKTSFAHQSSIIKCQRPQCIKSLPAEEARIRFRTCSNCYAYYCSRQCRKQHQSKHKEECPHTRISQLCKQVLMKAREDSVSRRHLSACARRGLLSRGRGVVKLVFLSADDALDYLCSGWGSIRGQTHYIPRSDLQPQEIGHETYAQIITFCEKYNPEKKFVLIAAIYIAPHEIPTGPGPVAEREIVTRGAKLHLSPTLPEDDVKTLIFPVTTVPQHETTLLDRQKGVQAVYDQLLALGVDLPVQYPEINSKLTTFVHTNEPFIPFNIFPVDPRTGRSLMCIILPWADNDIITNISSKTTVHRKASRKKKNA